MHGGTEAVATLIAGALVCWFLWWISRGILLAIASLFSRQQPDPIDEDTEAMKIVSRPVQMPGGQWMAREFVWRPCDAPIEPNSLIVHDRTDPKHRAVCAECREGQKFRGSGVSYRSN